MPSAPIARLLPADLRKCAANGGHNESWGALRCPNLRSKIGKQAGAQILQQGLFADSHGVDYQLIGGAFDRASGVVLGRPDGEYSAVGNRFVDILRGNRVQRFGECPPAVATPRGADHAGCAQCRHGPPHHDLIGVQHLGERPRGSSAAAQIHVNQDMQQASKASVAAHEIQIP